MSSDISKNIIWPGWETVRVIGRGSFGAVYEIQRDVAGETEKAALKYISIPKDKSEINMLRQQNYDDESITAYFTDYKGMFEREYSMMMRMKGHANVVYCEDIRTVQQDDGFGWDIYIKMELLEPLTERIKDGMTEEQIIKLGRDMCSALMYCEKMNVIHRDIKPENIFITREGSYKLGDFGIARTMEGTRTGTVTGTPGFMAPEVANNRRYNSTADIYSLGLTLYWLLNGHTGPFLTPGKKPTPSEKQAAQDRRLRGYSLPEPKYGSSKLNKVVLKACEYDPKERYQTAKEMLDELKKLIAPKHAAPAQPGRGRTENSRTYRSEKSVREKTATKHSQSGEPKAQRKSFSLKKVWFLIPCVLLFASILLWRGFSGGSEESESIPISVQVSTLEATPEPPSEPIPIPKVVEVSSNAYHTVFLKSDGTVVAVGENEIGQCDVQDWIDIVAVSAGLLRTVGLKSDGTVITTYDDVGDTQAWKDIIAVNAAMNYTVGVRTDGTVLVGEVSLKDDILDEIRDWTDIIDVSVGDFRTFGLKSDGTVVAAGYDAVGACNIQDWTDIVAVDATPSSDIVGLKSDGTVVSTNSYIDSYTDSWRNIIDISVGEVYVIGLKSDGTVVALGRSGYADEYINAQIREWSDIIAVHAGDRLIGENFAHFALGVKSDGSMMIVTDSAELRQELEAVTAELETNIAVKEPVLTPAPTATPAPTPKPTPVPIIKPTSGIVEVSSGKEHVVFLKSDGTAVAVGTNFSGECNVQDWTDIDSISAGEYHTVGLRSDGTVFAVGSNTFGQCNVHNWRDVVAISTGTYHTIGLKSNGMLVTTGYNISGQCNLKSWTDIVAISAGTNHTVGIRADGTAVTAGDNILGQCNVRGSKNLIDISAGAWHTVGLKDDGTVVAAGLNGSGQCNVQDWEDVVAVSAGPMHTAGLKSDGTVVATGSNGSGQCNVQPWTDIVSICASKSDIEGFGFTIGLKSDGTVLIATESEELRQQIESVL